MGLLRFGGWLSSCARLVLSRWFPALPEYLDLERMSNSRSVSLSLCIVCLLCFFLLSGYALLPKYLSLTPKHRELADAHSYSRLIRRYGWHLELAREKGPGARYLFQQFAPGALQDAG